jgi:dCMP deaminase
MKKFFLDAVKLLAQESKCVSRKVGAIIVKEGRIISMGYNGTPVGYDNCCDIFDENGFDAEEHHAWSNVNEIHAEMNAILFAAKSGISIDCAEMYCTLHPCNHCLKNLVQSGIKTIYYLEEYPRTVKDVKLLSHVKNLGITIEKI